MLGHTLLAAASLAGSAAAGTVLWDGRFNNFTSSEDLNNWSWANQVGPYQYYIHGSGAVTDYVNLSPDYKNPADTSSKQGVKITIDSTAKWNSDMWRTELIPQTTAAINAGKVYYHFSISRSATNAPSTTHEHQVNFFESHFTELKYGWVNGESGESNANLQWMVGGSGKWSAAFDADVWHNVAYEIDFSAATVTFWHSTGSDALVQTAGPFAASTSSNGADWHLGVLRLPRSGYDTDAAEDWFFSGVYVESGDLTTAVAGPGETYPGASSSTTTTASTAASSSSSSSPSSSSAKASATTAANASSSSQLSESASITTAVSMTPVSSSSSSTLKTSAVATTSAVAGGGVAKQYAQCGGSGWTGATACETGTTCQKLNDYYSQCL
ncbi:Cellulose-binding domain fungal [Neofusicoccum parvum]|nr:Cellulose-binding domain fungal [Neofusicoccum parvum]